MKKVIRKLATTKRNQLISITDDVRNTIGQQGISDGLCIVYVPHTTAGITINENADPDVVTDILDTLDRLVPPNSQYRHTEGNSDAHMKASLMGNSVTIMVENGELALGRWQGIFFCEFDGPRNRTIAISLIA